jgi:hypothetical protein
MYLEEGWKDIAVPMTKDLIDTVEVMERIGVPKMPVYVYKTIADEVRPVAET